MNVPPSKEGTGICRQREAEEVRSIFEKGRVFFATLGFASDVEVREDRAGIGEDAVSALIHEAAIYIPLSELVDTEKEIERLRGEEKKLEKELARSHGMLSNEKFIGRAPAAKVEEERRKLAKYEQMMAQVQERLKALGC